LPNSENSDPKPKHTPRRIIIRLTRNLFVYYRQPAPNAEKHHNQGQTYANKIYERTKKEARSKPIEFFGLIILFFYTWFAGCQSCELVSANRLTRQIVRSTISASLACSASQSFSHMGSREAPMTGAFYVACNNVGKVAAENVSGTFNVRAKTFPGEKELWSESWPFGGSDKVIEGNGGDAWPFHTPKYSPEREPQSVTDGKEVIVAEIAVSFVDETGRQITRRFCQVEMNWANLGGSPDGWTTCQMMVAEKAILTNPRPK